MKQITKNVIIAKPKIIANPDPKIMGQLKRNAGDWGLT